MAQSSDKEYMASSLDGGGMIKEKRKHPFPAQRLLDEQGYLVIWQDGERMPIGHVFDFVTGPAQTIPGPIVIIGMATVDNFDAQCRKWMGRKSNSKWDGKENFYKVAAE